MGREIRRVPKGWEHPRDDQGHLRPMLDQVFDAVLTNWLSKLEQFKSGDEYRERAEEYFAQSGITAEQIARNPAYYYAQYAGGPPDSDYYRPPWPSEPTCYQIYETVTEGTPVSPVFETREALIEWLVGQGYSERAATVFASDGWAPSLLIVPGRGVLCDIHALDVKLGALERELIAEIVPEEGA